MFKKYIIILMVAILISLLELFPCANAELVTQETAQEIARAFLLQEQAAPLKIATKTKGEFIIRNQAAGLVLGEIQPITDEDGEILAYVQELEPQGFTITSADDAMRPILGFSFEGYFFSDSSSDNLLLNFVRADIKARKRLIASNGSQVNWKYTDLSGSLTQWGPFIDTYWHQGGHYNDRCPLDPLSTSDRSRAGCVAISLGQIVNCWQYPKTINFDISDDRYKSKGKNGLFWIPDTWMSQDYPNFSDLNSALSSISYSGNDDEEAHLVFGLGVKIRMSYSKSGSGASHFRTRTVLADALNYGSARYMNIVRFRDGVIIENRWSQARTVLIENMKSGFPAILGVLDVNTLPFDLFSGGSHSIIADGYRDGDGYFHLNIGWGPLQIPLWYDLPDFTVIFPGPADYDVVDDMIYDICPNQGWNQYGANARNTFSSVYSAPSGYEITQKWRATCPEGFSFNNILIGTSNHVYAGVSPNVSSGHSFVYIIDQFGTILWQIELDRDGQIDFMCQSKNGDLFAAVSNDDAYIYRVDPKQGLATRIFTEPYGDQIQTLKIDEEGWLFGVTFERVYALTRTGAPRWAAPFVVPSGSMTQGSRSMPAIDVSRQRIYIAHYNSTTDHAYLAALNRLNGQAVQTKDFGTFILPSLKHPSLGDDGTVYIGMNGILYSLDPDDFFGNPRWTKSLLITTTPAVGRDGTLYVTYWEEISSNWFNKVAALDPSTGDERWYKQFDLDEAEEDIFQPYIASNGVVIFTIEHDGSPKPYTLHAYKDNGTSAEELWDFDAGVSGGSYAFGPGRTVYAWGMTGRARTIYALSEGRIGDPFEAGRNFEDNEMPISPVNLTPADGDVDQDADSVQLSWDCSDPDGHDLTFDIYACALVDNEEASFVPVGSQVTGDSYWLTDLQGGTQYLWSVVATDGQAISEGPVWSFTTRIQTGSLQVMIFPQGAVTAGAQWRRVGTSTWLDSSDTEGDIPVGEDTVEFKEVSGWNKPSNMSVIINDGQTTVDTGTYIQQTGSLQVMIFPQDAVTAGAHWRRLGTSTWFDSSDTEGDIPVGEDTVEFKEVSGWNKPSNMSVIINDGQTTVDTGTYTEQTGVQEIQISELPKSFALSQNYPNPFNPHTEIEFALAEPSHVKLEIYNILGKRIITLVDEQLSVGHKKVLWDGRDQLEREVASGIYFYRIQTRDFTQVKKMVLLK